MEIQIGAINPLIWTGARSPIPTQNGNAFLYILIAIALFAGLTLILTRGHDGGDNSRLSESTLQTNAQRILATVNSASDTWLKMKGTGTDLDEVNFILPTDAAFNTAPTLHKFFHPDGGGFLYRKMDEAPFQASSSTPVGWYFTSVNVDWSPTSGTDFVMSYVNIDAKICARLNYLIRSDASIPTVTVNYTNSLINGSTPIAEADCAACKQFSSICIENGGVYTFFNLIDIR